MHSSYSADSDTEICHNPPLHNITTFIKMFTDPEHAKTSAGDDFTMYKGVLMDTTFWQKACL
jgi:hypothetical protein